MAYRKREMEVSHLKRALFELAPFCVVKRYQIGDWTNEGNKISLPFNWSGKDMTTFECFFNQELPTAEREVYLNAWFGGETLVKIDGKSYGEVNEFHKEIDLTSFCDGKKHRIEAVVVPRGLFGTKEEPIFKYSYVVVYDKKMREIFFFTKNVISVIEETDDESLANYLIDVTNDFLQSLDFPRDLETFKKGLFDNITAWEVEKVWDSVEIVPNEGLFSKEVLDTVLEKFESFKEKVKKAPFSKHGTVYVVGHSHIDYAWLWPVEETKRKIIRTFANAVFLAKKYDYFIYSQSSAQMYQDLKEIDPELFEEVKKLVEKGQWEPAGGMWVESDTNLVSVESLIRQFYYGQKFFEKEFGKRSDFCWLPDVFGFSWVLPQILVKSGIKYFVTTKLSWNESNRFPYDICWWQGIDGSRVLYYSYKNDDGGYNGNINAKSLINSWKNFRQKELTNKILITVGYGDGGGGPTEEMCQNYIHLNEIPGIPKVEFSTVSKYLNSMKFEDTNLPVWNDELYLEFHRGTYTSQSKVKKLHKLAEDSLRKAEIINALSEKDYQEKIDELWKILLRNEFHDILPGSSIRKVYKTTEKELSQVIEECEKIIKNCVNQSEAKITLFNPSSFEQRIKFELKENLTIEGFDKVRTYDEKYLYYSQETLPPLGTKVFDVKQSTELNEKFEKPKDKSSVESKNLRFVVFEDGTFNIYDKRLERWIFKENGGNKLVVARDVPAYYDNWDIDINHERHLFKLNAQSIKLVEENELRAVFEVVFKYGKSWIVQHYIFWFDEEFVEIRTKLDWSEKRTILKAVFETDIKSRYAKYDLDCGFIDRPTTRNTSFEMAKFEVPAHRWVDLSEYDYGVTIANNCKYGHSAKDGTISLSLIKSGIFPDFYADVGIHEFSYAVYPHLKLDLGDVVKFADVFNKPIEVLKGGLAQSCLISFCKKNSKTLSLRRIGKSYYLRFGETVGSHEKVKVSFNQKVEKVWTTNLLDEIEHEIDLTEPNSFIFELKPFEIKTIRVDTF
ncbi:alpha-mannosidase [Pseudothermotoga thermarum]|uniref:Glycoside hydrolase family 38 n=1 Tax=Pseudothermotoga thermarum DSM 5069 TaxID=688269 RepID=F7YUW7_9THEM|nr:glycoside hydrolase family 38 C-terminal domain-containing protein [Pseudothermotoga thermarum]AEH51527.1 glycoside hydrolase family 38 [Pseudothermotoga thermarum DSM 5069]